MKVLGLDLGTNSLGWALRNLNASSDNQIEKVGVVTFNKGVGSGEYSFAAERTKKRSIRRLYQARKYRLWSTLDILIQHGFCPLNIVDLNKWRHYNKEEAQKNHNGGRSYPVDNEAFEAWIKLDFDGDGKPDYTSPYQLRKELAETKLDFSTQENRFKLGRALYHIAQRRGFKSSRKTSDDQNTPESNKETEADLQYSEKKRNKRIQDEFEKHPEAKTIGQLFALLEDDGVRIRENIAQHAIRENYKDEIRYIFEDVQQLGLDHPLYTLLVESKPGLNDGAIFYRRPLRSQKGSVGKCTLERDKYRAPVSHPAFEIFRAWSFLNNIKYKSIDESVSWQPLPQDLKQEIFREKFFRKSRPYFPFIEIADFLMKKGHNWAFNYKPKTTVMACPVSARLQEIFGDDYLNVRIPKAKAPNSNKAFYDLNDIWHVLFSFEDKELISDFAERKLGLNLEKANLFVSAWNNLPVGYSMLSLHAINKINRFLQKGFIYTEAVLLANLPEILGEEVLQKHEDEIINSIQNIIDSNRTEKRTLGIVNDLIAKHKNLEAEHKFGYKDSTYKLSESDLKDIQEAIQEHFGITQWNKLSDTEKNQIENTIKTCYQAYFNRSGLSHIKIDNDRYFEVHCDRNKYLQADSGFYRIPRLIDSLKEHLKARFNVDDKKLDKVYHPSEISIYQPVVPEKDGSVKLGSPKTGSFKNPMAMRTLHELKKLINYLIETNQIDQETRVVVEIARELNDRNRRWAIEKWQRQREEENQQFAEIIKRLLNEVKSLKASPVNTSDIDKIRLLFEQSDEQTLPPVAETDDNKKGKRKKTSEANEVIRWEGLGNKFIDRYRLWKEQGCQCIYTGKLINLTDLFSENVVDIEHTIPRSLSFDTSLANLTVCYQDYNRSVKKKKIPTQLANYDQDFGEYTAIAPRLERWKEKIARIEQQVDFWRAKAKMASEKKWKDDAIRQRHLWQMELEYWKNKLDRFTMKEITSGFKNSQKIDTQLISKYAYHYLKTYFDKVDVQKGSITSEFRKIYGLQAADEKKDRSKHTHHAKDAAVLTLIPVAVKRDEILQKYYEAQEQKIKFSPEVPYSGFKREHIFQIDDFVLINNISKNQTLTPARKRVKKKKDGTTRIMWATGDTIRGQIHQETFYGAIKPVKRDVKGVAIKDQNGHYVPDDKIRYVVRVPFLYKKDANTPGFKTLEEIEKKLVDDGLKMAIKRQVEQAGGLREAFDKGIYLLNRNGKAHGNRIRHVRVWANVSDPLPIKKHTYISKSGEKEYKHHYYAGNETNSYFAIYQKDDVKSFEFRTLFDVAKLTSANHIKDPRDLFPSTKPYKKGKQIHELPLRCILRPGTKVLFKRNKEEDIQTLLIHELSRRLYVFTGFEKDTRLNFRFHLEARNKIDEKYVESVIDFNVPKPTLRLTYHKSNFYVEGIDFEMKTDGSISWLQKTG